MGNTDDQGRDDERQDPTAPPPEPPAADDGTNSDQQPWAPPAAPADPYHGSSYPPPGQGVPGQGQYPQGSSEQQPYGQDPYGQGSYGQGGAGQDQPYPAYGQQPQGTGYPEYGPQGASGPGYPAPAPPAGYPTPYQPAYGAAPAYAAPRQNTGALVLTIVSGVTLVFCGGLLVIPALILGIIGLTKQNEDPEGSSRMTRYGWWAYAAGVAVTIIAAIAILGFFIAAASSTSSYSGY
jgi:hypothetical protein